MADLRQSPAFARYLGTLGWKVEKGIFIRPLWIFGALAKIQRIVPPLRWNNINKILKKHHVWMLQINYSPSKTLRVDLAPSLKKIFANFKKDCRYILRKLKISNFKFQIDDFQNFYKIWQQSARRKSLWIPNQKEYFNLIKCFKNKCFCITVNDQAGALILIHDSMAYYYYAGATKEGVKQNLPYLVVWKCIQEAKRRKCKLWDFEGIYDDRFPNKDWLGFSHFKKSFGGTEISFPGSVTKWGLCREYI
ncbi:peptidoglycan bridge formation glycyltransferase FemA/FemB family protein [Candidatus Amesbacteria bacterium]|nr:peptidoglycan bridge formation glycyltransferase FemA/FemB family protein [Candidatus Amesbacteria bacterium]